MHRSNEEEESENEEVEQRPWSNLCQPILELILSSLTALPDYIRFGSVCSSWRQAQQSRYVRPNTDRYPWLIRHRYRTLTIFTHSGLSVKLDLPPITHAMDICGSGHGWLLFTACVELGHKYIEHFLLLNPITNSFIPLPTRLISQETRIHLKSPALISAPPTHPSCAVVFISDNTLILCRPGMDKEWSTTGCGEVPYYFLDPTVQKIDMAACNGKIYVLAGDGRLGVLDTTSAWPPELTWLIHEDRGSWEWPGETQEGLCRYRFLVESSGELLMVLGYCEPLAFEIYKADLMKGTWLRVQSIGDRVLFLGQFCSLSATGSGDNNNNNNGVTVYLGYPGADEDDYRDNPLWDQSLNTWKVAISFFSWHWMQPSL